MELWFGVEHARGDVEWHGFITTENHDTGPPQPGYHGRGLDRD